MFTVALAPSSFAPHTGGVEELTRQLAHEYRARRIETEVLTMRWPKSLPRHERIEGTPVSRYSYRLPEGGPYQIAKATVFGPATLLDIGAHLRRARPDVVHIQCVSSAAAYVTVAARASDIPVVATLQGELTMDATAVYERSPLLRRTLRHLLRRADAVTACSVDTLDEAISWSGIDPGPRASVVPNGIRVADFEDVRPYTHPRPYFFAIGRHVAQKGFDVLLDAFALALGDTDFTPDLLIAGDGPERASLEARARDLGLTNRVTFLGATDRSVTPALFAGCLAFVLPSRHEPFGIVNLEAMAAGRLVIATQVGGVPEFVIDDENGLLAPPNDPGALATSLQLVARDEALRRRLADGARRTAPKFDWSTVADRYLDVYDSALRRHHRSPLHFRP